MKFIDITGQRFGRLTVQEFDGREDTHYYWKCVCDCGNVRRVGRTHLRNGHTKSCGCLSKEVTSKRSIIHGHCRDGLISLVYTAWTLMMQRCYNHNHPFYKNYGGRGIKVCERWHTFENFYEDMGERPLGMTLDRKDNDGDYCKENCRWATREEQANNRRSNVWYTHEGETKTIAQWAHFLGMRDGTLRQRLKKNGWSMERAISKGGSL